MMSEKENRCAICKKPETPDNKLIKFHTSDGLVKWYHDGKCLDRKLQWDAYSEEKEASDYGIRGGVDEKSY